MIARGVVTEIDRTKVQVRVKFVDTGMVSAPLQVLVPLAKDAKFFALPRIDEQVVCYMDDNYEDGVVLGAVYTETQTVSAPDDGSVGWVLGTNRYAAYYKTDDNMLARVANSEVDVRNASAHMKTGGTELKTAATGLTIKTSTEDLKQILTDILTQLEILTVTCAAPGSPSTPPVNFAAFTAIKLRLLALFS